MRSSFLPLLHSILDQRLQWCIPYPLGLFVLIDRYLSDLEPGRCFSNVLRIVFPIDFVYDRLCHADDVRVPDWFHEENQSKHRHSPSKKKTKSIVLVHFDLQ